MKLSFVLGLTGPRQSGKDTLFGCLNLCNCSLVRYALADELKTSLGELIKQQFGWRSDTSVASQKEILRPLYIGYGMSWRAADPLHWVKIVDQKIKLGMPSLVEVIPCITDFRFPNEVEFFKHYYKNQFHLIEVTRDGAPDPTDEEKKHVKEMSKLADYHLKWGNDNLQQQLQVAKKVLNWIKEQRHE